MPAIRDTVSSIGYLKYQILRNGNHGDFTADSAVPNTMLCPKTRTIYIALPIKKLMYSLLMRIYFAINSVIIKGF